MILIVHNPDIHNKQSMRLKGYDYTQNGAYFVTLCTKNRMPIFGTCRRGAAPRPSRCLCIFGIFSTKN